MKEKNNIQELTYWYNAMTGNVEWTIKYKSEYTRTYAKGTLPKKVLNWLQSDKAALVKIGDTGEGAWHVEKWAEK